jgi:hypothetical protein
MACKPKDERGLFVINLRTTTTELIITASTFTAGLLKIGSDTHHRQFVL